MHPYIGPKLFREPGPERGEPAWGRDYKLISSQAAMRIFNDAFRQGKTAEVYFTGKGAPTPFRVTDKFDIVSGATDREYFIPRRKGGK